MNKSEEELLTIELAFEANFIENIKLIKTLLSSL